MAERQDLRARALALAGTVLDMYPRLAAHSPAYAHIVHELFRSVTSMGTQLEEGAVANSRRDMASKYAIALREAREALFWSRLGAREPAWSDVLGPIAKECNEFVAMLTVSVRKLRRAPTQDPQTPAL
jgi:four helix bundle protein